MGTKVSSLPSESAPQNHSSSTRSRARSIGLFLSNTAERESRRSTTLDPSSMAWRISRRNSMIFDPETMAYATWNTWLLVIVLYDSWLVPLLVCFNVINPTICNERWLSLIAMSCEVFFLVDVYVQLHTGYYVAGNLVRSVASTRRRYLFSWNFLVDALALIPLPLLIEPASVPCGIVLINKLLRMHLLPTFTLAFDKVFARYFKFCKVLKVIAVSFFFCHYMACIYVSFGSAHNLSNQEDKWKLIDHSEDGHNRLPTQYFAALFWVLGLISKCLEGEIPRTLLQTVFTIVVMLGGFLLFVYICGTLFMISKCDANSSERFDAKLNQLKHILSFHHVPKDIQHRAIEFLENGFKCGDANDRNTIKLLCPSIAKDVKFSLLKSMVSNVPFFRCCNGAFIRALIDLMETQSLPTNFVVCNKGDQGEEMYFVQSGVLAVLINDVKVRELRKGGFFGELSLFTNQVRTANVTTSTFCIVHKLSRSHVRRVMRAYPQFESQILACVKSLLDEMNAQSHEKARGEKSFRADTMNKRAQAYGNFVSNEAGNKQLHRRGTWLFLKKLFKSTNNHVAPHSKQSSGNEQSNPNHISPRPWLRFILARSAINRKSRLRLLWLLCIMVVTLYNVFTVPLLNTFQLIGYPLQVVLLNTFADAIQWIDIIGNFNLSYVEEAEPILDTFKCAEHYIHSKLQFDLFCAFPWWILYPPLHLKFRFIRMLRFIRLSEELEEVSLFVRIDSRRRIIVLGIGLFLCYHIAGCLAHSLALIMGYSENENGWLPPTTLQLQKVYNQTNGELVGYEYMDGSKFVSLDDPFVNEIILEQYARALQYGAVCLTNLGRTLEPENAGEFILAFCLMLFGMLLISLIIDEVQKRVTASAIEQMEFLSTRSRILHFLQKQKAPIEIHQRVSAYLDFWWSAHRGANINELLGELPNSMQRDIYGFICSPALDVIQRMDHIGDNIDSVTSILLDNLVIHLYGQGEFIFRKGDYADAVYILLVGRCGLGQQIRESLTLPMRELKHGDFFGCSSLHLENENVVYTEEAIARSACVVAMVNRATLFMLNQAFPSFCECILKRELKRFGEHRAMSKTFNPEELSKLRKKSRNFVIDPDSNFSTFWETLLFFGMVFQTIGVPFYMAFGFEAQDVGPLDSLSIFLEMCFLIDIILKTRTGYKSYGNKVMDVSKIRSRYLRSFDFVIDVLAVIPLNLANITRETRTEAWNVNKLLRLFKLSSQIENLERHYYTINIQIRVFKLVFYIYLLSHYVGCTWYNFASNASNVFGFTKGTLFGHTKWLPSKEFDLNNHEFPTIMKYTRTFYWGMGLLIGFEPGQFPSTPLEYFFTLALQTIGVFLLAYVVGNLLDIVQVMEGNNRLFYSNLNYVRKLTKYFDFTSDVKSKIQHFYFYRLFHSIHEEHVLTQCLSPPLVADIRLFLLTPMLNKVPFFQDETASSNVTRSLVSQLCQILVTRGEVVCRQNEIGVEMYFIFTGCLEVYVATNPKKYTSGLCDAENGNKGLKVNELHAGSFFGEKSLFSDQPRNASIEAKTFCTLYKLSRKHLQTVFTQHPEWKAKVMQIVEVIYEKQQAQIDHEKNERLRVSSDINGNPKQLKDEGGSSGATISRVLSSKLSREKQLKSLVSEAVFALVQHLKVIEVQSAFYRRYLSILCFALLYVALSVPYFVTFGYTNKTRSISAFVMVLDLLTDIIFVYDIWFKGHLVETTASREFYEHRLSNERRGFWLDIITVLPIDYVLSALVKNSALLRFNRFIKLRQLTHTISEVHKFSMSYELNRLKLLGLYYCIVCYWTACGYFGLTFIIGFGPGWNSSLPVQYFNGTSPSQGYDVAYALHQVLRCFYYSMTIYTGAGLVYEPHAMLDFAFLFVISVFGVFVMGYVIGEASTLCIYLIQNEVEFMINKMNLMEFLARKKMDKSLQSRVHVYLSYWWSTQEGVAYQSILEQLPPRIRSQATIQMARMSLARFSMRYIRPLCEESQGVDLVINSIAHRLVFEGYPAGESVIVQGNIGQMMYFVSKGKLVTVSTMANFTPTRFVDGQYFGEEGFLSSSFCRYSVVTLRACDLLALSSSDFLQALNEHPRFAECCAIAWDAITNHPVTMKDLQGSSDVGDFVYDIMVRRAPELEFVKPSTIHGAENMFRQFLRLFIRQMPDSCGNEDVINQGVPIQCQHCEDKTATLYCKFCLQGLCGECSSHIHENNHFASHLPSIIRLNSETASEVAQSSPSQFSITQIVKSWRAVHKLTIAPGNDVHEVNTVPEMYHGASKEILLPTQEICSSSLRDAANALLSANTQRRGRKSSIHKNPFEYSPNLMEQIEKPGKQRKESISGPPDTSINVQLTSNLGPSVDVLRSASSRYASNLNVVTEDYQQAPSIEESREQGHEDDHDDGICPQIVDD